MAPVDLLNKLKDTYFKQRVEDPPVISTRTAALLSVSFTLAYVLPFYLSPTTRPSPTLNRDAPSVIRARVRTVTLACCLASVAAAYLLVIHAHADARKVAEQLGWWPINLLDILSCLFLTILLFTGPLFDNIFIEQNVREYKHRLNPVESLSSWRGYRNFVAGPVTEEVIFRSVLISIHLMAKVSALKIVFLTPLYFGIAHVHHFYEFKLTHPHTPVAPALLRSVFQFAYTSIFGWYASFIYLRTGSIYACILIHAFCNWAGFPRLWGRMKRTYFFSPGSIISRPKMDTSFSGREREPGWLPVYWTVMYYALLVGGAYVFYLKFWSLTESQRALAPFGSPAKGR